MGAGIALYFTCADEPPLLTGSAAAALGALLIAGTRSDGIRICLAAMTSVAVGFAAAQWRTEAVQAPVVQKRTKPLWITGTVEHSELSEKGGRIVLSTLEIARMPADATPAKIRISIRGGPERIADILPGARVRLLAVLRPPPPPTMPGAFDFQRRAFFQRIGAYGFILGDIESVPPAARAPPMSMTVGLMRKMETARLLISKRVHEMAEGDGGAVAAALLTGHRSYIREDVLQNMRDAGIAHLLAISGLHIGLVAGIVFSGIRFLFACMPYLGLRVNGKKAGAMLAIPAAFTYAVLAGFTVPTERAFLMTGLMLAGVLLDRRALSMRSVCWAATVILLFRPESLTGPGFQMSFAAVTALIAAYSAFSGWRMSRQRENGAASRVGQYLAGVLLTTVVASAATAPFAIYHFQHAAAFGLIANAVAVPLAAFWVMPAGIVTLIAMPVGLDGIPLHVMCTGIDLILTSAAYLAALPGAAIDVAAPPLWSLNLIAIAGLWLALWKGRWRLYALPFLALGLAGPLFAAGPDVIVDGEARTVAVLQNQSVYLTSASRAARFETDSWRQRMGQAKKPQPWQRTAEQAQGRLRCDADGCTVNVHRKMVAISLSETTLEDDCRRSWMILATVPVRGLCHPPWGVIDRFDLWRNGTHAITFTDDGPVIRTVNGERGRRPWVIGPD